MTPQYTGLLKWKRRDKWYSWQYHFSYVIYCWRSKANLLYRNDSTSFCSMRLLLLLRNSSHDSVPNKQTNKRICFFSRCCKPTSFLCLKHFIWHGNTETTSEKLPTSLQQYLSCQQKKNSLLAVMLYECIAKRRKYIFIRLNVITQLDNGPCMGSPQQSCITLSLHSTLILSHHIQPS